MGMQEQLNQQSEDAIKQGGKQLVKGIVASIRCAAFGTEEFLSICTMIAKGVTNKVTHNNVSVAKLTKMVDGRPGDNISKIDAGMTEEATKSFKKYAAKNGIKYSVVKDGGTKPPTYSVFFAAKDTAVIEHCIKQYVNDMAKKQQRQQRRKVSRESVKAKMDKAKEKMKQINHDKERNKDRSERER